LTALCLQCGQAKGLFDKMQNKTSLTTVDAEKNMLYLTVKSTSFATVYEWRTFMNFWHLTSFRSSSLFTWLLGGRMLLASS